jgi:nucleoside-diphosphate-sugar epimerase
VILDVLTWRSVSGFWERASHRIATVVAQLDNRTTSQNFSVRQAIKIGLDGVAGVTAVLVTFALGGFGSLRGWPIVAIAAGVGAVLVVLHGLQGSYRNIWRYSGFAEGGAIALSCLTTFGAFIVLGLVGAMPLYPSSALTTALLILLFCGGVRALRRWQAAESKRPVLNGAESALRRASHRILIAGAGERGLSVARDIMTANSPDVELLGFLDDDPTKIGATPCGRPVLGPLSRALPVAERLGVNEIIAAMPSAAPEVVRVFSRRLEEAGIRVRALRGIDSFVSGRDIHRPGQASYSELVAQHYAGRGGHSPRAENGAPRVLLTGGAGYIGSHLTRLLLDRGYHVRVLDRLDYGRAGLEPILQHPRLELMTGDICDSRDVSRAMRDVNAVLALAAIVGDPACNLDPEETIQLNYSATKVLVETAKFYGVQRLVFASSCSVYGANDDGLLSEDSRLSPVSLYARTRVLSENILFDRCGDVEPVVLRLATVFGVSPRMRFDLVVNTLTIRALVDGKISIFGGNQWRPNVHCRDVARAFATALAAPSAAVSGQIFNVGGDANNHLISDMGEMVASAVGGVEVLRDQDCTDPRNYRVSFAKIRRLLAFEPEFAVRDGIEEVMAAVRANPALRHYQNPVYHNVQQLKRAFEQPRRRRTDFQLVAEPLAP